MFWLSPGLGFIGFGIPVGSPRPYVSCVLAFRGLRFQMVWYMLAFPGLRFHMFWLSPGLGFICFGSPCA